MATNKETAAIQWRPEVNALTTPPSYRLLFVSRGTVGDAQLVAEIAAANPNFNEEAVRTILNSRKEIILQHVLNGEQVVEEDFDTITIGITGRLEEPEDPPPPVEKCTHVRIHPAPSFVTKFHHSARLERLPMEQKLPLINTAQDTLLELKNVLNPQGLLQLTGHDLLFDRKKGTGECVIAGTRSGRTVQTRFGKIEQSEVIIMPDVPTQDAPWNNEYTVSISTRYSVHGTLRTGTYNRMLRTPLLWDGLPHEGGRGVLTGSAVVPYVTIESGVISANTSLRLQVMFDAQEDRLLLSLLDMNEGGAVGTAVPATANGTFTLQGYSGSAVSSMSLIVHEYDALKEMVRNNYSGRLVDIIVIELA